MNKIMQTKLIETISLKVNLSVADITLFESYFELTSFAKNEIIEEQDKIPEYLYFINSGYMRLFYYDENGDEVTTHFVTPSGFIASYLSLIHNTKAVENVECITDCTLLKIHKLKFKELVDKNDNFKTYSLLIFQEAFSNIQTRANDLATLSAEQRYKKLIETNADILQNVPIQYIASFLGMKPESLSRIRRQMNG
jgi:CRP/FNR family transcriptional regulator, anaerobic regulatory protein